MKRFNILMSGVFAAALFSCAREQTQVMNSSLNMKDEPELPKEEAGAVQNEEGPKSSTDALGAETPDEPLNLTQAECTTANVNRVTISPRGQLYINDAEVLNDNRAKNDIDGTGPGSRAGKWSFAYALREILELPADPGNDPTRLAAEQAAVDAFIARLNNQTVNTIASGDRSTARLTLTQRWGTRTASNNEKFRWLGGAPFKLVAIVNRMDIVKKTSTGAVDTTTAGEGRFVYGFTGPGPMTVIFEYNLPAGSLSPAATPLTTASWTLEWHKLKNFLADTNTSIVGIQPNQSLTGTLAFGPSTPAVPSPQQAYLTQLETVTEKFANRAAQKRSATLTTTQAAISQIRTNEFIEGPWELREIVRNRNSGNSPVLANATVKNSIAPSQIIAAGKTAVNVRNNTDLGAWVDANVSCQDGPDANTTVELAECKFSALNGMIPASITQNSKTFRLGPTAPATERWFSNTTDLANIKRRFFALESCDGCHRSETGVFFLHTNNVTGEPSSFLTANTNVGGSGLIIQADLQRRLMNAKNLVCLAVGTTSALNVAGDVSENLDLRNPEWYTTRVH